MIGVGVVDTGLCNRQSIMNALSLVGASPVIVRKPGELLSVDAVVLPGVGAFRPAMQRLESNGLDKALRSFAGSDGGLLLGICLGMQLLADGSEEGGVSQGLGLIAGQVRRLQAIDGGLRVPNMGWCDVAPARGNRSLLREDRESQCYYFAHSYHLVCDDPSHVAGTIEWGASVCAAVESGCVMGVQFHPEKSQDAGLALLERFVMLAVMRQEQIAV